MYVDSIIIGAGVIGLACARALANVGQSVVVLERDTHIGSHASARNSEVIHAGIYYPTNTLKAQFCVAGKHALYDYACTHHIDHKRIGKFIIANGDEEENALIRLKDQAEQNGVDDVQWVSKAELHTKEPDVRASLALYSPSTGIIDNHNFLHALVGDIESKGGVIALKTPFEKAVATHNGFTVHAGGSDPLAIKCRHLINAAGAWARDCALRVEGLNAALAPQLGFVKGQYAGLQGVKTPFHHLIYPLPDDMGLGIHATLDLAGQCRFGPDTGPWCEQGDYSYDITRLKHFYTAIRRYWPDLPDGALTPGMVGVRTKVKGVPAKPNDFIIEGPDTHSVKGLINLYGFESPGLTASLAVGAHVQKMLA